MEIWQAVAVFAAGAAAGAINAAAGSGTMITFPALLALGYPPLVANVSNNIGMVPGGLAGAWGYRDWLVGQRSRLVRLVPASALGGAVGAVLLLVLPAEAFETIVPVLILVAIVLVAVQPWLARRVAERNHGVERPAGPVAQAAAGAAGVYGGYFGAAQGVLLIGLLGWVLADDLQRVNALKNVLAPVVNLIAATVFVLVATDEVDWAVVALIATGSTVGGFGGSWLGRRLPVPVLRALIVVIGLVAVVRLVLG
jgi:uncharacterized membrane protein YfcA